MPAWESTNRTPRIATWNPGAYLNRKIYIFEINTLAIFYTRNGTVQRQWSVCGHGDPERKCVEICDHLRSRED